MAKQDHVRALALVALVDGVGAKAGGVDMTILVDACTLVDGAHAGINSWRCSFVATAVAVMSLGAGQVFTQRQAARNLACVP